MSCCILGSLPQREAPIVRTCTSFIALFPSIAPFFVVSMAVLLKSLVSTFADGAMNERRRFAHFPFPNYSEHDSSKTVNYA